MCSGASLLKKVGLHSLFQNCRLISNLQYVSKLTEKTVFNQTHLYMKSHTIYPKLQSSYRQYHSTETALHKVTDDILLKINVQEVTLLVTLDLNSAFGTVDQNILLNCLQNEAGIRGKAWDWFKGYLYNRGLKISINGTLLPTFRFRFWRSTRFLASTLVREHRKKMLYMLA